MTGLLRKVLGCIGLFALALLPSRAARAAEPLAPTLTLSVEEAVLTALKNNRDLAVRKLRPVVSGAFEEIARSTFNPEVFSDFQIGHERSTETARATEDQFSVEGTEISGDLGIRQQLPIGMEIETNAEIARSTSTRTPTQNRARVGLGMTQQLLRGLGPTVNLAEVRLASLDTRADRYELEGYTAALVADIETTYWRYVAAAEAIAAVKKALATAEAQLTVVETRIEVGTLPENERAFALSEVGKRKQALIDAQAYRNEERYRLLSKLYPNAPIERVQTLTAAHTPVVNTGLALDTEASLALAEKSRPEISEATIQSSQGDLEIAVTKNGLLPKLELFIQLGKSGYADSFAGSIQDIVGPNFDVSAGLRLRHLVGNRRAKAEKKIAVATKQQAEDALANLKSVVRTDVLIALNELERARAQVSATAETAGYREQALTAEQAKYEAGAGTLIAVTLAQRDLLEARIDAIKAEVAFRIAETALFLAEGTLLKRRGIRLDP